MPCRVDPTPQEIEASRIAREKRLTEPLEKEVEKTTRRVSAAQKEINNLTDANNALSVRVDYLQDLIWRMDNSLTVEGQYSDDVEEEIVAVLERQTQHRQADIDRLVRTLSAAKTIDYAKLSKVLAADITKPLEPQLGFDPDEI